MTNDLIEPTAENLIAHFQAETQWRPGMGVWIGATEKRLRALEVALAKTSACVGKLAEKLEVELSKANTAIAMLEGKVLTLEKKPKRAKSAEKDPLPALQGPVDAQE